MERAAGEISIFQELAKKMINGLLSAQMSGLPDTRCCFYDPRIAIMQGQAPALPPITVPTCVRWAEHDPLFPYAWTDRLSETFVNLDLVRFLNVGHFPHREDPDRAAGEISAFFNRLGWQ
jgi:pimeloyl-ACP methyl ester carboxylesterase